MAEGRRERSGYNFAEYFGDGVLLTRLQVLPEQQSWRSTPPKQPGHVPVVLYLGCNVLRTGHLVQTVHDLFTRVAGATGLQFESTGGPAYCCGIVHHREGETETAAQMSARTLSYFEQFSPERVVMWCPSCIYFYDEIVQAKTPYRVQHVSEYLLEHREVFGELEPLPGKVALHYHNDTPARLRERDAVRALLGSVPGLELLDPGCEPGWGRSCTWPATEAAQEAWRARAAGQLQTAVDQGADTLATMYHGCQRLLCGYEAEYPLTIEHYLTVFGRAAGIEYPDTYKHYLNMADPEAILADAAPCMRAHNIDESRAREVVTRHFATGKGI